jgi:hypothetical protein
VRRKNFEDKMQATLGKVYGTWRLTGIDPEHWRRFTVECVACGNKTTRESQNFDKGCRPCKNARQRDPRAAHNDLLRRYKAGANRGGARGLAWELTDEQFFAMTQSNCTYCGVPPVQPFVYKGEERFEYNGVDRVDSSKGYTPANCVPCCEVCNKAKRDLPLAAFEVWLRRVAAYWQDRNIPVTVPGVS